MANFQRLMKFKETLSLKNSHLFIKEEKNIKNNRYFLNGNRDRVMIIVSNFIMIFVYVRVS